MCARARARRIVPCVRYCMRCSASARSDGVFVVVRRKVIFIHRCCARACVERSIDRGWRAAATVATTGCAQNCSTASVPKHIRAHQFRAPMRRDEFVPIKFTPRIHTHTNTHTPQSTRGEIICLPYRIAKVVCLRCFFFNFFFLVIIIRAQAERRAIASEPLSSPVFTFVPRVPIIDVCGTRSLEKRRLDGCCTSGTQHRRTSLSSAPPPSSVCGVVEPRAFAKRGRARARRRKNLQLNCKLAANSTAD